MQIMKKYKTNKILRIIVSILLLLSILLESLNIINKCYEIFFHSIYIISLILFLICITQTIFIDDTKLLIRILFFTIKVDYLSIKYFGNSHSVIHERQSHVIYNIIYYNAYNEECKIALLPVEKIDLFNIDLRSKNSGIEIDII